MSDATTVGSVFHVSSRSKTNKKGPGKRKWTLSNKDDADKVVSILNTKGDDVEYFVSEAPVTVIMTPEQVIAEDSFQRNESNIKAEAMALLSDVQKKALGLV